MVIWATLPIIGFSWFVHNPNKNIWSGTSEIYNCSEKYNFWYHFLCLGCEKNSPTSSSSTNSTTHHSLNRSPTRRMAASSSCPSPLPPELRETATGINSGTPSSHQQSSRHKPLVVAEGEYRGVVLGMLGHKFGPKSWLHHLTRTLSLGNSFWPNLSRVINDHNDDGQHDWLSMFYIVFALYGQIMFLQKKWINRNAFYERYIQK